MSNKTLFQILSEAKEQISEAKEQVLNLIRNLKPIPKLLFWIIVTPAFFLATYWSIWLSLAIFQEILWKVTGTQIQWIEDLINWKLFS